VLWRTGLEVALPDRLIEVVLRNLRATCEHTAEHRQRTGSKMIQQLRLPLACLRIHRQVIHMRDTAALVPDIKAIADSSPIDESTPRQLSTESTLVGYLPILVTLTHHHRSEGAKLLLGRFGRHVRQQAETNRLGQARERGVWFGVRRCFALTARHGGTRGGRC